MQPPSPAHEAPFVPQQAEGQGQPGQALPQVQRHGDEQPRFQQVTPDSGLVGQEPAGHGHVAVGFVEVGQHENDQGRAADALHPGRGVAAGVGEAGGGPVVEQKQIKETLISIANTKFSVGENVESYS